MKTSDFYYDLPEELIAQDPQAWKTRVEAETDAQVIILKPGESLSL